MCVSKNMGAVLETQAGVASIDTVSLLRAIRSLSASGLLWSFFAAHGRCGLESVDVFLQEASLGRLHKVIVHTSSTSPCLDH